MKQRFVPWLIACVASLCLLWAWWPTADPVEDFTTDAAAEDEAGEAALAEADAGDGPADGRTASSAASGPVAAGASGVPSHVGQRLLEVRDLDGEPLPGVAVYYELQNNQHWDEAGNVASRDDPSRLLPVWWISQRPFLVTDTSGQVGLPEEGWGYAAARVADRAGVVGFVPVEHQETTPIVLQLQGVETLAVEVVDARGQPAVGYEVHYEYALAADLARPDVNSQRFLRSAWKPVGLSLPTDAEGRTQVRTEMSPSLLAAQELDAEPLVFRVRVALPFQREVVQEVRAAPEGVVRLQLPEGGVLRLQLEGYPASIEPMLTWTDPNAADRTRRRTMTTHAGRDGAAFLFRDLPLGESFEVSFRRNEPDPGRPAYVANARFPEHRVPGPVLEGEVAEATVRFAREQVITGRLLGLDGQPERPTDLLNWGRWRFGVEARHAADPTRFDYLVLEVEADGRFLAFPSTPRRGEPRRLDEFDALYFQSRPESVYGTPEGEARHGAWKRVPLQVAPGQATIDLGDVQLGQAAPDIVVRVVDREQRPVHGALLRGEVQMQASQAGEERWGRINVSGFPATHVDGEARFAGFDFDHALSMRMNVPLPAQYRMTIMHDDYLPQVVHFDAQAPEQTVVLERAESILGSVEFPDWMRHIELRVMLPEGEPTQLPTSLPRQTIPRERVDEASGERPASPFELKPVPSRPFELLAQIPRSTQGALFRLRDVLPGPEVDPRLDPLRVEDYVQRSSVEILLPGGQPLYAEMGLARRLSLQRDGMRDALFELPAEWHERRLQLIMPRGERLQGLLTVVGCRSVRLEDLPLGESTLVLEEAPVVSFLPANPEALPEGWTVRIELHETPRGRVDPAPDDPRLNAYPVQRAGFFHLAWHAQSADATKRSLVTSVVEISEELAEQGGELRVDIPEDLLAKIRRQQGDR